MNMNILKQFVQEQIDTNSAMLTNIEKHPESFQSHASLLYEGRKQQAVEILGWLKRHSRQSPKGICPYCKRTEPCKDGEGPYPEGCLFPESEKAYKSDMEIRKMDHPSLSFKFGETKEITLNNKGAFLVIRKILLMGVDVKHFLKEIADKRIMISYKLTDRNGTIMLDFGFQLMSIIKSEIDYKLPVFDEYIRIPDIDFFDHYPFELKIKFGSSLDEIKDCNIEAMFIIETHDLSYP